MTDIQTKELLAPPGSGFLRANSDQSKAQPGARVGGHCIGQVGEDADSSVSMQTNAGVTQPEGVTGRRDDQLSLQIRLAALASQLIKACDGFVSAALECDISKSQLQRAADPHHDYSLKASTIYHLEQACGQPIMSQALLDMATHEPSESAVSPVYVGIDLADSATDLTVLVRGAVSDGTITITEHREISQTTTSIQTLLAHMNQICLPDIPEGLS